jgi:hypothetical protein
LIENPLKHVRLLPVDPSFEIRFLEKEEERVRKEMERRVKAIVVVDNIRERNRLFFVLMGTETPIAGLQIRPGDVIELEELQRLGIMYYPLGDYHFYAIFENIRGLSRGSIFGARKANELLLVQMQEQALTHFLNYDDKHYVVLREVILRDGRVSQSISVSPVLKDKLLNASQRKAVAGALSITPDTKRASSQTILSREVGQGLRCFGDFKTEGLRVEQR